MIDGPSSAIVGLDGLAVARDGTGGLVYEKTIAGIAHVFVSTLVDGNFQPAVQVDAGLVGPSSQPVIAATDEGIVVVAFVNGGELYAVQEVASGGGFSGPVALFAGASNPSISMSPFGKAYVAFTAAAGHGNDDVRTAYYYEGQWAIGSGPLDVSEGDNAGAGTGRPDVVTAGDGTAIVAWGESGHIYTRRVLGISPSTVYEQADPPAFAGWNEVTADDPQVSAGGDSSYATVAFREELANGPAEQSRVLVNHLQASQFDGVSGADGLSTPGPEGADQPQASVQEYGSGFVTSERTESHAVVADAIGNNDQPGSANQVNSLAQQSDPDAVPATAGTISTLIAWQQDPGSAGIPEIRVRYAADGVDLGPELVVSSPSLGATNANLGLFAGGDLSGDAAIAWVQGSGPATQIVAAQLFQAPGSFGPSTTFAYSTSPAPLFTWSSSSELWGPTTYTVKLDGVQIAQTTATAVRPPTLIGQGRHVWQVTASNPAGLAYVAKASTVFVDTLAPQVSLRLSGTRRVGVRLRAYVSYSDRPPGLPPSDGSGVKSVQIRWAANTTYKIVHRSANIYTRRGNYTITVTVYDRAGNRTILRRKIKVAAAKHGGSSGNSSGGSSTSSSGGKGVKG